MKTSYYILESKKKGTKEKFKNAGPYRYKKKSDFGSMAKLKKSFPELVLRVKKVSR